MDLSMISGAPRPARRVLTGLGAAMLGMTLLLLGACRNSAPPAAGAANADAAAADDGNPVVARIAGTPLRYETFERKYQQLAGSRQQAALPDSLETPRAQLNQYVGYRLKIRAAQEAGYEKHPDLRTQVNNYRRRVARPLLLKKEVLEPITRTLYKRKQHEIDVSHILLRLPQDAPPSDTLAAYRKLEALADSARQGVDFGALARRHSQSAAARRKGRPGYEGHLGYVSAGRLVKPFEDAMYRTPVGGLSNPVRTRFGYHLIKVHDRRATPPDVRLSHLMVQARKRRVSQRTRDSARRKIEAYRRRIMNGADFAEMARKHSDHQRSAKKGGDLGIISPDARLPSALKKAAFALDSIGAVSDVIETRFGYHLLKLTGRREPRSYAASYEQLKKQATKLPRTKNAEQRLAGTVRRRLGTTADTAVVRSALLDSTGPGSGPLILEGRPMKPNAADRSFATLGDSTYTVGALADFVQRKRGAPETVDTAIDYFLNDKAVDYEAALRVRQVDSLRRQVQRYRNGLLLFQLMQDSVWSAAARNDEALRAHYRAHRAQYRAPKRAQVLALSSDSLAPLRAVTARLQAGDAPAQALAAADAERLPVDTAEVAVDRPTEAPADPYAALVSLQAGDYRGPSAHESGFRLLVRGPTLPAAPQSFEEARPAVVRDYQQAAEHAFVQRLRRRYDVETYPERLPPPSRTDAAPGPTEAR